MLLRAYLAVSGRLTAGLENCLKRLLCTSAARVAVFLRSEGAFSVSVDRDDSTRAWHLELEVCVVRHRVELCKRGSSEQSVIAAAKWDYVKD